MEYGRNVSEAEVKKAEFLNFLRAPKEIQTAMSRFDPSSSGYNKMQNLAASARYDAEQANARSGAVRQVGTDGVIRNIAGSGGGATDGQVNRAFAERLPPELTRALSPQGDADRAARRAERQPWRSDPAPPAPQPQATAPRSPGAAFERGMQDPTNARGVPGATFGEVNGQQMLVPEAGQYGRFRNAMGQLGLDGTMGVDRGQFEQARHNLVMAQERGRRGEKFEARKAAQQQFEQQKELAGLKNIGRGVGKSGDTVDEAGQKAGQRAFYKDRSDWIELQNQGREFQGLYDSAKARGMDDNDVVTVNGKEVYVGDLASMSKSYLAAPEPRWEQYGQTPAAASTPGAGGLTDQDKAEMDRLSGPALDRAIQRAEKEGWTDDLAYLRQRKAGAGRVAGR